MARIRTVKPEFWTDETVGEISVSARLLFVGTWTFADDHGNLDRSSRQLKAQIFPYDDIDCEPLVQELLGADLLIEYEADGKKYLHIKGFREHQKVEKPGKPRVPLYDESLKCRGILTESSPSPLASSLESKGVESNGADGKGERARVDPRRPGADPKPMKAGEVCTLMKAEGLMDGNPSHPDLLALLEEGAGVGEFTQAASEALEKGKGFAYALAIVRGRRRDAAQGKPTGLRGPLVRPETRPQLLPDALDVVRARDSREKSGG